MSAIGLLQKPEGPWYRQPWPWLLMAGPLAAVIGGVVTAWIAVTHQDGLVVDDYYRQGLAINRTMDRERAAGRLGVTGQMIVSDDGRRVRVLVAGLEPVPATLSLRLIHSTVTGMDRDVRLARTTGGWFEGDLGAVNAGKWTVLLEDASAGWRVSGRWLAGSGSPADLRGRLD